MLGVNGLRLRLPSEAVEVHDHRLQQRNVRLLLKREDLIHPELTGNKWRKLKYNLTRATEQGQSTLLTFGGAYSNHIRATAAAGYHLGFKTIGIIRGEQHLPLNESLTHATARGMTLFYIDRSTYRRKMDPEFIAALNDGPVVVGGEMVTHGSSWMYQVDQGPGRCGAPTAIIEWVDSREVAVTWVLG